MCYKSESLSSSDWNKPRLIVYDDGNICSSQYGELISRHKCRVGCDGKFLVCRQVVIVPILFGYTCDVGDIGDRWPLLLAKGAGKDINFNCAYACAHIA